jgi:3-deoxy-D-manno-octulosonic acid kinase
MRPAYQTDGGADIVYDADRLDHVRSAHFDPQYWEARAALIGQAAGRGTTWFVQQDEEQWALRHYKRGGLVAKLVTDRYLWLGLERSRAWREWHLTARLHERGLPVPAPVAARVIRDGISYRADLITQRIQATEPLSQRLQSAALSGDDWRRLGVMLRRFHAAGLDHADMNAHNVLLNPHGQFWLIDFDQARLRAIGGWREGNLQRLQRSLKKLQGESPRFFWTEADWAALRAGYASQADG